MIYPRLDELKKAARDGYKTAPVATEIFSDDLTPVQALRKLNAVSDHVFMLESVAGNEQWGRYTFLGFEPKTEITCVNGVISIDGNSFETNDPRAHIARILEKYKSADFEGMPPFTGGLVGYFSYDYLKYAEPSLRLDAEDTEGFKDVDLMLFDKVIAFDNFRQKIILIVNVWLSDCESEYARAEKELDRLSRLLRCGEAAKIRSGRLASDIRPLFGEKEYCDMVERAKHYIKEGDIFQIVLSNRLEADFQGSLLNAYRVLRTLNPSPYMFYFNGSDLEVAGASPETLVKLENGILHTFPLAGSRPRGKTEQEDKALEEELLRDEKELAEHNMLVDLGRNDIGKISKFGTVKVEKLREVQRYSHIMHIGSTVRGELADGKTALDALDAILPAGTLSGAPKIRACQLINDLENNKRGIYGGAIGYLGFSGNLDTCIAIRIAYKKNGKVFIRSGAGIVADSVPGKEYTECINKAAAVVAALKRAEELNDASSD